MSRPREELEYWNVPQMVEHALEMYPELGVLNRLSDYKKNIEQTIRRYLEKYNFIKATPEGTNKPQYQVPVELAQYIINFMLRDTILTNIANSKDELKQLQDKEYEQALKELEKLSAKRDSEMQERYRPLELAQQLVDLADNEEEQKKLLERVSQGLWWQENVESDFITLSNGYKIHKDSLKYHIPDMSLDELDAADTVDRIVDRVMLRTLFSLFFEFDEKAFRLDLYERAAHINTETQWKNIPELGHGALEQRLADPLTYYMNPKRVPFQTNQQAKKDAKPKKSSSSKKGE